MLREWYHRFGYQNGGYIPILTKFGRTEAARRASKGFGLVVLEVENSKLEFCLQIKILLYKSTSGNTKMASEIELVAKQNNFISVIPDYFSASEIQCISLIIFFC